MRPCSDQSHLQFQVFTRRGRHKEQLLCLAFQFEFSLHDVRSLEDLGKYVLGYLTCRADPFRRLQSWKLLLFYSLVTGLRGRSCSPQFLARRVRFVTTIPIHRYLDETLRKINSVKLFMGRFLHVKNIRGKLSV